MLRLKQFDEIVARRPWKQGGRVFLAKCFFVRIKFNADAIHAPLGFAWHEFLRFVLVLLTINLPRQVSKLRLE